jgi:hypothetical protein
MRNQDTNYDDNPFLQPADPRRAFFPFETIDFSTRLEVLDPNWTAARETRRQRIRFRESGVTTYFDFVWGDGVLFANYSAQSMHIIDAIKTQKGYVVVLALPRAFHQGEQFDVVIERRIVGAFYDERNYWESVPKAPAGRLSLDVVAPRGAGFRTPDVVLPPNQEFDAGIRGKTFQLRIKEPQAFDPYRLTWLQK